jgi:hypothetical protein
VALRGGPGRKSSDFIYCEMEAELKPGMFE